MNFDIVAARESAVLVRMRTASCVMTHWQITKVAAYTLSIIIIESILNSMLETFRIYCF